MEKAATEGINILLQYGILGVACVLLIVAVYYLLKRADRKEDQFMSKLDDFNITIRKFSENEERQTIIMGDIKGLMSEQMKMINELLRK
jgi:hypothetical protein